MNLQDVMQHMSVARPSTEPTGRVNNYTVVVSVGSEDGVDEGDEVLVSVDGQEVVGTTTQVGRDESVVELWI